MFFFEFLVDALLATNPVSEKTGVYASFVKFR